MLISVDFLLSRGVPPEILDRSLEFYPHQGLLHRTNVCAGVPRRSTRSEFHVLLEKDRVCPECFLSRRYVPDPSWENFIWDALVLRECEKYLAGDPPSTLRSILPLRRLLFDLETISDAPEAALWRAHVEERTMSRLTENLVKVTSPENHAHLERLVGLKKGTLSQPLERETVLLSSILLNAVSPLESAMMVSWELPRPVGVTSSPQRSRQGILASVPTVLLADWTPDLMHQDRAPELTPAQAEIFQNFFVRDPDLTVRAAAELAVLLSDAPTTAA